MHIYSEKLDHVFPPLKRLFIRSTIKILENRPILLMNLKIPPNFANWKRLIEVFCMSDISPTSMLEIIWERNAVLFP